MGNRRGIIRLFFPILLAIPSAIGALPQTPTRTGTPTRTETPTPTFTPTQAETRTPTWTETPTVSSASTRTATPTPTGTTPTLTNSPTSTPTSSIAPGTGLGICAAHPWQCVFAASLEPNIIVVLCERFPCVVIDPMPQNCLAKWPCPGCGPFQMCPPYYHLLFDDTLKSWRARIVDGAGKEVAQKQTRFGKNLALSFRPSEALFKDGSIGDYILLLEPGKGIRAGVKYPIHVRLQVSDHDTPDLGRSTTK